MDNTIIQLRVKENNLRKQYENKVEAKLRKIFRNKINSKQAPDTKQLMSEEQLQNDLYHLSAQLFGYEEQLFSLQNNTTHEHQVDFVNNLSEFDFTNAEIEQIVEEKNDKFFMDKFDAARLNHHLQSIFRKNSQSFIKGLVEFVNKRNVYRKKPNDRLLQELVLLKAKIIKHLCVMQKLAEPTRH
ncbi:PKIP [Clanis bilineata nucleopolyhedrovirus]|uniref:PKIP n=1 Tax=Clanis bilineata nucleopolyhedrovirus TaxID=1307957 RepID=Q0N3Z4_9ABAC|nr:PKIP [Clanis bilineata nucleopolyhedrovirus]ABF47449.1 PKIP [Clanis bilineata nucleopolyhedrovirus]